MTENLRQFVYLDSLAVQSLLASLNIPITEETREVTEESYEGGGSAGAKGGVNVPGLGELGGKIDLSGSKTGTEILETTKRINDQYLFSQLYQKLKENDDLTQLPEERPSGSGGQLSFKNGQMVEIEGMAKTDPFYRMLNVASVFANISGVDMDENQIQDARESIYGEEIGLVVETSEGDYSYAMSMDKENLWIDDPRREFLGTRSYTVLGRVEEIVPPNKEWDYIDLLRVAGTVLSDDSIDSIREVGSQFVDLLDGFEQEVPFPDLGNASPEDLQGNGEPPTKQSSIKVDIEDKALSVEGVAVIIQPIAIYW
jgi:hypothetical protein